MDVRKLASRQRPKGGTGGHWTQWRHQTVHQEWGLYSDYRVLWRQLVLGGRPIRQRGFGAPFFQIYPLSR
jgi:hypothetical protein